MSLPSRLTRKTARPRRHAPDSPPNADFGDRPGWISRGQIASGVDGGVEIRWADLDGDGRDDYLLIDSRGKVDAYLNRGGDPAWDVPTAPAPRRWSTAVVPVQHQ
ncbi:hypothetical protein [Streptomyces hirsutus]|uniref:hypothetical protein n=1 Tax=Streptomyces hirsutus TaxID=35620 RepID=UPI0011470658|nr:hypothetical protein [Streptomyces hirsutus]